MLRALWTSRRWAECRGLRAVHRSVETRRRVLRPPLTRPALSLSLSPFPLPSPSPASCRSQFSSLSSLPFGHSSSRARTLHSSNSAAAWLARPCILQAARNVAAGMSLSHHHAENHPRVRGKTDSNAILSCLPLSLSFYLFFPLIRDTASALTNGGG